MGWMPSAPYPRPFFVGGTDTANASNSRPLERGSPLAWAASKAQVPSLVARIPVLCALSAQLVDLILRGLGFAPGIYRVDYNYWAGFEELVCRSGMALAGTLDPAKPTFRALASVRGFYFVAVFSSDRANCIHLGHTDCSSEHDKLHRSCPTRRSVVFDCRDPFYGPWPQSAWPAPLGQTWAP